MLSAYVLIETEVGKVAHVAQALIKLDGVQLAGDLAGPTTSSRELLAPSQWAHCRCLADRPDVYCLGPRGRTGRCSAGCPGMASRLEKP